jgi:hypothetical protein
MAAGLLPVIKKGLLVQGTRDTFYGIPCLGNYYYYLLILGREASIKNIAQVRVK